MDELSIQIEGKVSATNFDGWRDQMLAALHAVKTDLTTEQDFVEAERQAKEFQKAEKKLDAAKLSAQEQSADIHALFRAIDEVKENVRQTRLTLQRQIKSRKAAIRAELVETAMTQVQAYVAETDSTFRILDAKEFSLRHEFEAAIKGAVGIPSAQRKLDQLVFEKQRIIDARLQTVQTNASRLDRISDDRKFFFPDREYLLLLNPPPALETLIEKRIAEHEPSGNPTAPTPTPEPPQPLTPVPTDGLQFIDFLHTLAEGINPLTKQKFPKDDFRNLPTIMAALAELSQFVVKQQGDKPDDTISPPEQPPAIDSELYEKLRQWRFTQTKEKGLPAFMILQNKTFEAISAGAESISELEDLVEIRGFGPAKLQQYGEEILAIVRAHLNQEPQINMDNSTPKRHESASRKEILGRDPDDHSPHYEVRSATDKGMGSSRGDTKKLHKANFKDLRNRNQS